MATTVHVHDTETGHDYFVSEERFRNPPKKGLWQRLDQGKPKTSVAKKAAAKKTRTRTAKKSATRTAKKAATPAAESNQSGQSAGANPEVS